MADLKPNQVEKMLVELIELKEKLQGAKAILRHYKVTSDELTRLRQAYADLKEKIQDEKNRIENQFLEEKDYEEAYNDDLLYKGQIKEKNAHLRQAMAQINPTENLSTYDYNIKGEMLKLQVQRTVKVYINGREER
ncbi:hypothetical protein HZA43_04395 [Candidatus Peregrinibacteria bacterium]|nr:hypothetical protein [Candidatus Peregrinibacteria bacterium]